ncbi:MAG: hypothetical protein LQ342_006363 [Letrouitia transgressa]|nr:MAG: hypothetical protein LQ342_006363 [Letrouitia transgressa]
MVGLQEFAKVARQVAPTAVGAAAATTSALSESAPECEVGNEFDGRIGLRISAIFVILVGSLFGAAFPVYAARHKVSVSGWTFFIAKYFGSGVIIATAFIHLLAPANEALTNECLTGAITEYPWVEGICLMTIFTMFFVEIMAMRYATFGSAGDVHGHSHGHAHRHDPTLSPTHSHHSGGSGSHHTPGDDHLGHSRDHIEHDPSAAFDDGDREEKGTSGGGSTGAGNSTPLVEDYAAQITAIFILEFGVIFHSIFVGLTLAVAGEEFNTLYVVLVFHQTFEGLGLGSRLAATPWRIKTRRGRYTPYFFALAYAMSTPVAMAVGLGARESWSPGSQTALVVNGVFDSISAGVLVYTGLVELMAHEFMFSPSMRRARGRVVLAAFGTMAAGAGLMALLGKWA